MKSFRVTVRGSFATLGAEQTAALVAASAEHDFLNTAYTSEGYLAYDLPGRPFFTFRYLAEAAEPGDAAAACEAKAAAWMAAHGYPIKNVSSQVVDPAEMPLGSRGRREAARRQP